MKLNYDMETGEIKGYSALGSVPEPFIEEDIRPDDIKLYKVSGGRLALKTGSELEQSAIEEKAQGIRFIRDRTLEMTDVFMLHDYPLTGEMKEQIIAYRQSLRDLTDTPNWPDITIPEPPEEIKEKMEEIL